MIIDFHGHLFTEWKGMKGMSPEEIIHDMDENGVIRTVVFTLNGFWGDFRKANDDLIKLTEQYRDRLIPFCTVHPNEIDKSIAEITRCKNDFGIKGIKFHPWLQGFSVVSDEMLMIAEHADRLGMILVFHDGTPPYCEPLQIANLAYHFPNLKIVLGHGGLKDYYIESILAVKKHKNIYIGTNFSAPALERLCKELNGSRILFGSDIGFGAFSLKYNLDIIHSLSISKQQKENILFGNSFSLLEN
ncbi:MAG: amidohydrolase [Spirochaetales bacterium]|nr:amidohydrolase [Spirochaetales bacterium]